MNRPESRVHHLFIALALCLAGCGQPQDVSPTTSASRSVDTPGPVESPEDVVQRFFDGVEAQDVEAVDDLFLRFPALDAERDGWLGLIERVIRRIEDDQLAWEVVCSKELSQTATVIVNQTMRRGRPHGDPDAVYLVRQEDRWRLLPDLIAPNAGDEVDATISSAQADEKRQLSRWATSAIRGLAQDCA